jgi:Fur family ferric uptake transcriptional regulator
MDKPAQPYGARRMSAQRRIIADEVRSTRHVFTVESLCASLADSGHDIGQATVYRAVAAMRDAGFIESLGTREGTELYAHCDATDHHHHMVCTTCGRVAKAPCTVDLETVNRDVGSDFVVTGHSLTLLGTCASCLGDAERAVR